MFGRYEAMNDKPMELNRRLNIILQTTPQKLSEVISVSDDYGARVLDVTGHDYCCHVNAKNKPVEV